MREESKIDFSPKNNSKNFQPPTRSRLQKPRERNIKATNLTIKHTDSNEIEKKKNQTKEKMKTRIGENKPV
ncbi:hypothetical protein ANTRET_LOCUS8660 [Anthophora retusa]